MSNRCLPPLCPWPSKSLLWAPALWALAAACERPPAPADPPPPPQEKAPLPDVILITLDTTRADFLGSYGRSPSHTETLDALAERGLRFDFAYSPIPLTIPAHSTLFTGLNVYRHNIRSNGDRPLAESFTTLAELLQQHGYSTAASIAAFVTQRQWGFQQGFDAYFDQIADPGSADPENLWMLQRRGDKVVDDALGWLSQRQGPSPAFLWVHFYDAHLPFYSPRDLPPGIEDPYEAELAFVDDQIQRLVDAVGDRPTLWVVAGDHGESRGEHREIDHGLFVYNATQRVPLFLSGPGISPGVTSQPVGLVDLLPTVLNALKLPIPEGLDGKPQPGNPHPLYLESWQLTDRLNMAPHRAIVEGDYKLIDTPRPELYVQSADPREKEDRAEQEPAQVARLQQILEALNAAPPEGGVSEGVDPQTLSQLAALGYVSGFSGDYQKDLPDPKDRTEVLELLQKALLANLTRQTDEEIQHLKQALLIEPKMREPRTRLIKSLAIREDREGISQQVSEAIAAGEDSVAFLQQAIVYLGELSAYEQVLELTRLGLEKEPDNVRFHEFYVGTLLNMDREQEAAEYAANFLKDDPEAWPIYAAMGNYLAVKKRLRDAYPYLERAAQAPQPRRDVLYHLALITSGQKDGPKTLELLERELSFYPDNSPARYLYCQWLGRVGRYDDQLLQLDLLLKAAPNEPNYLNLRGLALINKQQPEEALALARAALEAHPTHPGLKLLEANALGALDRDLEAAAAFEEAKKLREALGEPIEAP